MQPSLLARLTSARQVLAGLNEQGIRVHPSMFDEHVISLAHGDGIRRPPATSVAAGAAAILDTATASLDDYMFLQHHEKFEAAVTEDFVGNGIPSDIARNVCVDSGTTRLFAAFLNATSVPGDVFGVPRSYYHPLPGWCELFHVNLELIRPVQTQDYKLTPAALDVWHRAHDSHPPRGLFLFNPTQTGALYTLAELSAIADVIRRSQLVVLEDAVFAGTEFAGEQRVHHLVEAAPDLADRVVTLKGASKAYNLANMRIGWGCGPAGMIRAMNDYTSATSATIPFVAKEMALGALRAPAEYLASNAAECARRATLITDLVAECCDAVGVCADQPVLSVSHQPQAGHAILVSAAGLHGRASTDGTSIRNSIDLTRFLLSHSGVATSPGYSLGFDGTELRLAFGSVGVRHTYQPVAAEEFGSVLGRLAVMCERFRPDVARCLHSASDAVLGGLADPGEDLFQPGRELLVTAFRHRITPALLRLVNGHGSAFRTPIKEGRYVTRGAEAAG